MTIACAVALSACERPQGAGARGPDGAGAGRAGRAGPGAGVLPPRILSAIAGEADGGEGPTGVLPGPLGACVQRARTSLTPELRAALDALSYGDFAEDSCRLALAPAARDPSLCDRVQLPQLARACRTRVAVARGERSLCPRAQDEPGPDLFCVALATRAFSGCPGAGLVDGPRCRAVAELDLARCRGLPGPSRALCEGDVRALTGVIVPAARPQPAPGTLRLEITFVNNSEPTRTVDAWGMERGAFVTDSRAIVLVDPRRRWPEPTAYAVDGRSAVAGVELTLGEERRGEVTRLRVVLSDGRALEGPVGRSAGPVTYTRASREVGHELAGTFTAEATVQGRPARIVGTFATFVRDVVSDREAREGAAIVRASDAGTESDDEPLP